MPLNRFYIQPIKIHSNNQSAVWEAGFGEKEWLKQMITHAVVLGCSPMRVVHNPSNQGRATSRKAFRAQLNPQHPVVVLKIESIDKHNFEIISSKHYLMSLLLTRKKRKRRRNGTNQSDEGDKNERRRKSSQTFACGSAAIPFSIDALENSWAIRLKPVTAGKWD